MTFRETPVIAFVSRLASRLRFPRLFLLTAAVFLADLAIPDVLPFVDEILLGLGTALLSSWRKRKDEGLLDAGKPRGEGGRVGPGDESGR